jgi:hypothetical protein
MQKPFFLKKKVTNNVNYKQNYILKIKTTQIFLNFHDTFCIYNLIMNKSFTYK